MVRIARESEVKGGYTPEGSQMQDAINDDTLGFARNLFRQAIEQMKQ